MAEAEAGEPIGSLAQETAKLLRAIASEREPGEPREPGTPGEHICTTGWCPICQVVGYLQDHPELVEQVTDTVTDAALQIGQVLRDFLDKTMPPGGQVTQDDT